MSIPEYVETQQQQQPSQRSADLERGSGAKKPKAIPQSRVQPPHQPSGFWDTLSKLRLSRAALQEYDRRNVQEAQETLQPCCHPISTVIQVCKGQARQQLRRFARRGGPDLTSLRGAADPPLPPADMMSADVNPPSRKRSSAFTRLNPSAPKITTRCGNFEQHMIDNGIYPMDYPHLDGRPQPEPANLNALQNAVAAKRPSLSPSQFTDADFKMFKRENAMCTGENTALYKLMAYIAGNEGIHHRTEMDLPFKNLDPIAKNVSDPKPDLYHGADPSAIDQSVRAALEKHIVPTTTTTRPAAPNFFLEAKGAQGRVDVVKRQAVHIGAVGARAMHSLQNYGVEEPIYDNSAYSYSCTYHAAIGVLNIFVTHPTQATVHGVGSEYHMTQLSAHFLTWDREKFLEGAAAYRNIRDLAKTHRDGFIKQANEVARQMSGPILTASQSIPLVKRPNTSDDELLGDEEAMVKRPRRAASLLTIISELETG